MDLTGWLEFFAEGLATQLGEVKVRGEVVIRTDLLARKHRLNSRKSGVLEVVVLRGQASLADLEQRFPEVNRRTLQRDLKALLDLGLLREEGSGPTDPTRRYLAGGVQGI